VGCVRTDRRGVAVMAISRRLSSLPQAPILPVLR
jgi:hypothetical protein